MWAWCGVSLTRATSRVSGQAKGFRLDRCHANKGTEEGKAIRLTGLDLRAAGMKAMAGAAMATRVAAKNFIVEKCEVCGWVDCGEEERVMSGSQAIYIFPCAVQRKGTMHEASPSQHMCARRPQVGLPRAPACQAAGCRDACVPTWRRTTGYTPPRTRSSTTGQRQQQARRSAVVQCNAQDLLAVRELSTSTGLDQVLLQKEAAVACHSNNQGREMQN